MSFNPNITLDTHESRHGERHEHHGQHGRLAHCGSHEHFEHMEITEDAIAIVVSFLQGHFVRSRVYCIQLSLLIWLRICHLSRS